jgi:L-fuculokinase
MITPVTAIFDIGKTNKKFFLFDKNYKEVYREYSSFDLIEDEDGYPTDNIVAIQHWMKDLFDQTLSSGKYKIKAINFSTYGASFVHVDRKGDLLTPLYNYTKPFPEKLLSDFYKKHGEAIDIALETGSQHYGMLNSGLQLYWLKYEKPEIYKKIRFSMHFPQYLSYLFTGIPLSEYTSIGCHTRLWSYEKNDYHDWVYKEGIDEKLPPVVTTDTAIIKSYNGEKIKIGIGIHDSSSALLPYIKSETKPFVLISTGTWSISLNPFSKEPLTKQELEDDCLSHMQIDGEPVKATRLFLGNEYKLQTEKISSYFRKEYGYHRTVKFNEAIYQKLSNNFSIKFHFESLPLRLKEPAETDFEGFDSFEEAFHQLMIELMKLQEESVKKCIGNTAINKIYIDGGFTENDIFVKLMTFHFKEYKIRTTKSPLGSALGASMVLSKKNIGPAFLKENYALQKHKPLILRQGVSH